MEAREPSHNPISHRRVLLAALAGVALLGGCNRPATVTESAAPDRGPAVIAPESVRQEHNAAFPIQVPIEGFPSVGSPTATHTIVDVTSFACPWCLAAHESLTQLQAEQGDRLRVVTRLRLMGEDALAPTLAACAAHKQGRYQEYARLLWERAALEGRDFSEARLRELAEQAHLDMARFEVDRTGEVCRSEVERDDKALTDVGIQATPTWIIDGKLVRGARPIDTYRRILSGALDPATL